MLSTGTSMIVCSVMTGMLMFTWLVLLCGPWSWISADNSMIHIDLNPWTVHIEKGSILGMLPGRAKKVMDMVAQTMWVAEATTRCCTPMVDQVFTWCGMWNRAKFSSYCLLFFAFFAMIFWGLALCCMLYYQFKNATMKGRQWAIRSLMVAPALMFFGMAQYTLLTWDFGDFTAMMVYSSRGAYNAAFVIGWILIWLSCFPLFVQKFLTRGVQGEKNGPKEFDDSQGQASGQPWDPNAGYGSFNGAPQGSYDPNAAWSNAPPSGYGAPAPGYDQQQQWQQQQWQQPSQGGYNSQPAPQQWQQPSQGGYDPQAAQQQGGYDPQAAQQQQQWQQPEQGGYDAQAAPQMGGPTPGTEAAAAPAPAQ